MTTAAEQYLIELVNRARLDPQAEADRYLGGNLNADNDGQAFTAESRQPLAGNAALNSAAAAHSAHMLAVDEFAHDGIGDGTPTSRMSDAGYPLTGSWGTGENIAYYGTTGTVDLNAAIEIHHEGLFESIGHRRNILNDDFRELGVGQARGDFTDSDTGTTYDASMLTKNFAYSGSRYFLTGVVYNDTDGDDFYSIGEAVSGQSVSVAGGSSAASAAAGGYDIQITPSSGLTTVTSGSVELMIDIGSRNVKLDFIGSSVIAASSSAVLVSGITEARLLGTDDLDLTGSAGSEWLIGNAGDNHLQGNAGNDILRGGEGADQLDGGLGFDQANYANATSGVAVDLRSGTGTLGEANGDTLTSIEALNGSSYNDQLRGNDELNILHGGNGVDFLRGYDGNDRLYGGNGNDLIYGDFGSDQLVGGDGNDTLYGGHYNDQLLGGAGNDVLIGGPGADQLHGGEGFDIVSYEGARSQEGVAVDLRNGSVHGYDAAGDVLTNIEGLIGSSYDDNLIGNGAANILSGADGADSLRGLGGHDRLYGGNGDDTLYGDGGNDILVGNAGFDTLTGGVGNDTLTGGVNGDTFVYADFFGQDTITDFEEFNNLEKIDLSAVTAITDFADLAANHLTQLGANAVITDGANTITLNNVDIANLDANDFIF
ncbi:CAP domain-containing protein [Jiella marina]|uniref:CAP domain-containing protein n=1 Tax=Jiella sp. LLJ827 TaxID=2917712 RepID=UPI0026F1C1F1|nr:CAP domain-containing protein [Jiella sp. LLJ827]